jgi:tRNA (uracil-5-)-methyltransferase
MGHLRTLPGKMKEAMRPLHPDARADWANIPWLDKAALQSHQGAPCAVEQVIASPLVAGYRSKCEFSFGRDVGGEPCLGFQLGQVRLIGHVIGEPSGCPNVSDEMKAVVARVNEFVRGASRLPVFDKLAISGFWRQLTARQTFNHEAGTPPSLLLVLQVSPSSAPSEAEAEAEVRALLAALQQPPLEPAVELRFGLQFVEGPGESFAGGTAIKPLLGEMWVEERLLSLSFRISPAAFFQARRGPARPLGSTPRPIPPSREYRSGLGLGLGLRLGLRLGLG